MRRFEDSEGRPWDVVLGRESWGTHFALFVPAGRGRGERVRQTMLAAEGYDAAQRELSDMDEAGMARLFAESKPKKQ